MNILSRNKVLIAGMALVLLTNIIVIGGAMYNRSGKPDAVVNLDERELYLRNWNEKENSGLSLGLNWNGYYYDSYDTRRWLNQDKLEKLGFDLIDSGDDYAIRQYVRKQLPRAAWIVLEFDGATYHNALQDAEKKYLEEKRLLSHEPDSEIQKSRLKEAKQNRDWVKYSASRIYAVDAGLDPMQLRQRYPDKSHYIVTAGVVQLDYDYNASGREKVTGYVSEISVTSIHVPLDQRAVFDSLPQRDYMEEGPYHQRSFHPRFRVRLAYGQRYEPWIDEVAAISD